MGEGPSCALHPERESAGVCASCGAPACATCLLPASDRCRACDERLRHGAEDLGVRAVFALAWSLFRLAFFPVAKVALACAIASSGFPSLQRRSDSIKDALHSVNSDTICE